MAKVRFYDLELDVPELVWSPNTCKTRYALNVKGIPYETKWLTFAQVHEVIPGLTKTGKAPTVPVIVDLAHGDKVVQESWEIAKYLEEAYPDHASLFNGNEGAHFFFHEYCTRKLLPKIFKLCVLTIHSKVTPSSLQQWFRDSREKAFKMPLEKFAGDPQKHIDAIKELLEPIGRVLKKYPYMTGQQAGWADVVLASYFRMLLVHRPELFDSLVIHDPKAGAEFAAWWKRMDKYMQLQPPSPDARM
ncbi:hypothetical protein LRAMOSA07632 [Lichtheimia ramosa]|uniref:GST C-terminal domain-containing protein n=1 Tax=Lichtheimia ramosa TaxID=688394 RepID=A0A077WDF0_9FUNG|nr:hypothetical protein LRAMOSA07632 [Lichtheimia ramosa]